MFIDRAKSLLLAACGVSPTKDVRDDLFEDAPTVSEAIEALETRS